MTECNYNIWRWFTNVPYLCGHLSCISYAFKCHLSVTWSWEHSPHLCLIGSLSGRHVCHTLQIHANSVSLLRKLSSSIWVGTVGLLNETKLAVPTQDVPGVFSHPNMLHTFASKYPLDFGLSADTILPPKTSTGLTFLYSSTKSMSFKLAEHAHSFPAIRNISMPALGRHLLLQVVLLPASPPPEVSNLGHKRFIYADPLRRSPPTLPTVWYRTVRLFCLNASENLRTQKTLERWQQPLLKKCLYKWGPGK